MPLSFSLMPSFKRFIQHNKKVRLFHSICTIVINQKIIIEWWDMKKVYKICNFKIKNLITIIDPYNFSMKFQSNVKILGLWPLQKVLFEIFEKKFGLCLLCLKCMFLYVTDSSEITKNIYCLYCHITKFN
jgi:hypothetical protein